MSKSFFATLTLLSLLTGCHVGHPKMLSFTPASVVIDYSDSDLHGATNLAQQYCSSINKDAQYVINKETGWISTKKEAFFNCVESTIKNNQTGHHAPYAPAGMPIINNFKN
jgi:hypothetical protein